MICMSAEIWGLNKTIEVIVVIQIITLLGSSLNSRKFFRLFRFQDIDFKILPELFLWTVSMLYWFHAHFQKEMFYLILLKYWAHQLDVIIFAECVLPT